MNIKKYIGSLKRNVVPILYITGGVMLKKMTPLAISFYFSFLAIKKCLPFTTQNLNLVIDDEFILVIASVFISVLFLFYYLCSYI